MARFVVPSTWYRLHFGQNGENMAEKLIFSHRGLGEKWPKYGEIGPKTPVFGSFWNISFW